MRSIRSLVVCLALAAAAPLAFAPVEVAGAADAVEEGPGVVAILPVPWAVADGETKVRMQVIVLSESGQPMGGLSLKTTASAGEATGWTEVGPGLYRFTYTPPKSDAAQEVTVTVEGKAGKGTAKATSTVRLARLPQGDVTGSSTPEVMVLGQNTEATLSFAGGPPKGDLLVRNTTSGKVTNLTNMGGGRFTARFEAPKENFPQLNIVTVANAANPLDEFGYVLMPLSGAVNYPVEAPADASVLLRIQGKEYGPVKAGADGKASVPVVVPPGVTKATQITVVNGESKESDLDLRVPETLRLKAIPTAKAVPADSSVSLPIRVVVLKPDGSPDPDAKLLAAAEGGAIGAFTHTKRGIHQAMFTPADSDKAGTGSITVTIDGSEKQVDVLEFQLTPRRATELTVTTDPAEIRADTQAVKVRAVATGSNGKPAAGQHLAVDVVGGATASAIADQGDGKYEIEVKRTADALRVGLVATAAPTGNPVAHVVVVPARDRLDADGASASDVVVLTVDAFGYPVAGVDVELTATGGAARLPATVKTNDYGIGRVELTAGQIDALVAIEAKAGSARGAGAILQGGKRKAVKDLPVTISGDKDVRELHERWEGAVAHVRLAVDLSAPPAMPTLTLAPAGTPATSVDVTFFPAEVRPGGTVTVRAIPRDAQGRGIPGETLDVLTSAGRLGKTQETKGVYETLLTVDAGATGEAKVSVVSAAGPMKLVKVPINPNAVVPGADEGEEAGPATTYTSGERDPAADGAADATTEEPKEPVAEKPPKEPKEPKQPAEGGDHPWLRARASGAFSLYRYAQTPSDDPDPLIPRALTVGSDGAAPALPVGIDLAGRAWVPDLPYVGALVTFRSTWYAIASEAFDEPAPDWLYDANVMVLGRYPFDVGSDQFWVGGKAGFHYDDFMLFTGCLEANCTVNYDPLSLPGLGLGAEVGAEIDAADLYFVGGFQHSLANFSVPYMNGIDVAAGMMVMEPVDVELGFSWIDRKIAVQGTESGVERGQLSDSQMLFRLGAGVEF